MAAGGSQRDARRNKVFKAMNRPLTVLGAERRLFFVALITGGVVFSLMHSLVGGIVLFIVGVIIARIATRHDVEILPPGLFSFHEELTFLVIAISLAAMQAVAFAVIAYGHVASAVCILVGPIFIPWFIVPKLDWLFWGWLKAFIGFSFYQVVASAFIFIFAKVLLGMLAVIGPITLFVCVFGLLKIPELTGSILGGRSGSWINPMGR